MSDEESFVILGTSPMSSLELDGNYEKKLDTSSSAESDTPGSNFSSLGRSQLNDLENTNRTSTPIKSIERNSSSLESVKNNAKNDLWSCTPPERKSVEEELCSGLEDCAIKSPINGKKLQKGDFKEPEKEASTANSAELKTSCIANNGQRAESSVAINNMASSFLMGEINADVLKTSVYSQFPSISVHSSAEEVVKLQNIITESMQLKATLEKVNNTMKFFHTSSLQWQEKMENMETKYKEKLEECQKEIEMLRKENEALQEDFKAQIEAIEIARQKDREETIKDLSEKNSLVENMRAQIIRLEQQQLSSFEVLEYKNKMKNEFDDFYISRDEHNLKIKELERKLSELYASNLDLKDVEKQYIDELDCLKVNLTSAEELVLANHSTIEQLQAQDQERLQKITQLEKEIANLNAKNLEQNERISLLSQQIEVYRKDFEMEKQSRSLAVREKNLMLQDLKNIQKRNKELIQEHQKLMENYERRLSSTVTASNNQPLLQLPSVSSTSQVAASNDVMLQSCPLCNKAFRSLSILQSHVNDCMDNN